MGYGIKVSKAGYDINDLDLETYRNLILNSGRNMVKILATGTLNITVAPPSVEPGRQEGRVYINMPQTTLADGTRPYAPAGLGTAVINGKRYRTEMLAWQTFFVPGNSPNDEHYFQSRLQINPDIPGATQDSNMFAIGRLTNSSLFGATTVFPIRYFIISMETG